MYRYYIDELNYKNLMGIPGQNMDTPNAKKFGRHFVVWTDLSRTYYDPSYGVSAPDISSYTPKAIGAWSNLYNDYLFALQEEDPNRVLIKREKREY